MVDFTRYKMYAETGERVSARGLWSGGPLDTHAPLGRFVQNFKLDGVNLASLRCISPAASHSTSDASRLVAVGALLAIAALTVQGEIEPFTLLILTDA